MIINVWLALRDDAQALIKTRLLWDEETQGEYTGPITDRQFKLFRLMHDLDSTQRLFRVDRIGNKDWTLWSLYFDFAVNALLKIQAELDDLATNFPNHVKIIGAWNWDGGQVEQGGSPVYPLHNRISKFMPGGVLSDINLGLGQTPRQF